MTADTIARVLDGRRSGKGWVARCPAHEDRTPSLSVRDADGGQVLVHCHAGCAQEQVIEALRARGLWSERVRTETTPADRRAWAKQQAADERDLVAARYFSMAVTALAEECLESLDAADWQRQPMTLSLRQVALQITAEQVKGSPTRFVLRPRDPAALLYVYRDWPRRGPRGFPDRRTLVEAGRAAYIRRQRLHEQRLSGLWDGNADAKT